MPDTCPACGEPNCNRECHQALGVQLADEVTAHPEQAMVAALRLEVRILTERLNDLAAEVHQR